MTVRQYVPHMNEQRKWLAAAAICFAAAFVTIPTVIGTIVFGLMAIGALVKWQTAKHGERPWWTKSVVTLWRERGDDTDD